MNWLSNSFMAIARKRAPDFIIGGDVNSYLRRWWVIPRNPIFNIYLHEFLRDDDDRALHDHPWFNVSVVLSGDYIEHTIKTGGIGVQKLRKTGGIVFRSPRLAHRISLINKRPCWTLFVTGPRLRSWGFHCPRGWVHWRDFTNPDDSGATVGRGCGEKA